MRDAEFMIELGFLRMKGLVFSMDKLGLEIERLTGDLEA